jgi:nickel/cobalt transporter (NicO) family protein
MDAIWAIPVSAAGIAFVHTVLGVDHTLPFVALSKARRWSRRKTLWITAICGIGHVLASVGLGLIGIALGWGLGRMDDVETGRGPIAAWVLTAFGGAYLLWGLRQGWRRSRGVHLHQHGGHLHLHKKGDQPHGHDVESGESKSTFWVLFTIFVLGPCEPLIPLFIVPASQGDWAIALIAATAFAVVTVVTMVVVVAAAVQGLNHMRIAPLEKWAEAIAGGVVAASGLAVLYLGV